MVKNFYQNDFMLKLDDKGFISLEFNICLEKFYKTIEIDIKDLLTSCNIKKIKNLSLNDILSFKGLNFDIFYPYNINFHLLKLPSLFNNFKFNLYLDDENQIARFEFTNCDLAEFSCIDDFYYICSELRYDENIDDINLKDKINIIKNFKEWNETLINEINEIKVPKESILINPCLLSNQTYDFELYLTNESFNILNSNYLAFILKDIKITNKNLIRFNNHSFIIENYLDELIKNKKYNSTNEGVLINTFNIKKEDNINFYSLILLNSLGGNVWDC